jgi:hypothetical protein
MVNGGSPSRGTSQPNLGIAGWSPKDSPTGVGACMMATTHHFMMHAWITFGPACARQRCRALNAAQSDREDRQAASARDRAADSAREDALGSYLEQMSELMLDDGLAGSSFRDEVRAVATTVTLTVVRRLDPKRQGLVLRFLAGARLITWPDPKISLEGADLHGADLQDADTDENVKWLVAESPVARVTPNEKSTPLGTVEPAAHRLAL